MPVTWSDEKLILLDCPGRGSNSRPSARRSFKHDQGVPRPNHPALISLRPFFFDYLVYGSADPILEDFEKKKKKNLTFFFFFFFIYKFSVVSPKPG